MPTRRPKTPEENISFRGNQIIGNLRREVMGAKVSREQLKQIQQQPAKDQILNFALQRIIARKRAAKVLETQYVNRETGRIYKPHHEIEREFVYNDFPRYALAKGGEGSGKSTAGCVKDLNRVRRGMNGIMGCVSGDTLIEGVPVAERNTTGTVRTLFGDALATRSFLKGRADLYRLETESGASVCVTLDHQFLSTNGWYPLRFLHVGDVIASDERYHDRAYLETQQDFRDGYPSNFRLGDGQPSPLAQYDQDIQQQLDNKFECSVKDDVFYRCRACIANSLSRSFLCGGDALSHVLAGVTKKYCNLSGALQTIPSVSYHLGSLLSSRQHLASQPLDTFDRMVSDDWLLQCQILSQQNNLLFLQFLQDFCQNHKEQEFSCRYAHGDDPFYSPNSPISEVRWTRIKSITFQKLGQFYDLTVPGIGHYSAQGLFHHNSPDFEHFKKSLWSEFRRWCDPEFVVEKDRYRLSSVWEPQKQFELHFITIYDNVISTLYCGGFDDPSGWEGPNINFAHFDEARRHQDPKMLKVLDGRVRIPGLLGEPPQIYLTTTPSKHWLFDYFGNIECRCDQCGTTFEEAEALEIEVFRKGICPTCGK